MSGNPALNESDQIVVDESAAPAEDGSALVLPGDDLPAGEGQQTRQYDEVVVEGDEPSPSEESVGPAWLHRRLAKVNKKVDQANERADDADRRVDAKDAEIKLLRDALARTEKPAEAITRPRRDDFDTDAEFDTAMDAYVDSRIESRTGDIVSERLREVEAESSAESQANDTLSRQTEHYKRAGALNVEDYEAVEDKAIAALGDDIAKFIMTRSPKSELILYHLGVNTGKAEKLRRQLEADPGSGALAIGELGARISLNPATRTETPEPAADLEGAAPEVSGVWQTKVDQMRSDVASGKREMKDLIALKKDAQAAGAQLTN